MLGDSGPIPGPSVPSNSEDMEVEDQHESDDTESDNNDDGVFEVEESESSEVM